VISSTCRLGLGLAIITVCLAASALSAAADSPTQFVRDLVKTISSIKSSDNGALSEADRAHNSAAAARANAMLDISGVSQQVLGRYWKERTPAEQQTFTDLLTELFVRIAYPKSATFFGDFDMQFTKEDVRGEGATVQTTVSDPKEGLIAVDYKLQKDNGAWRIRDIVLDDVSLTRNLRSQCQKIIAEHSYDELLRRMREKLDKEAS
jgi:phospholipid transport system substrate-binding protein